MEITNQIEISDFVKSCRDNARGSKKHLREEINKMKNLRKQRTPNENSARHKEEVNFFEKYEV